MFGYVSYIAFQYISVLILTKYLQKLLNMLYECITEPCTNKHCWYAEKFHEYAILWSQLLKPNPNACPVC